jgi:hypothetical protein
MITTHMRLLLDLFADSSPDCQTLDELRQMLADRRQWHRAHDLFSRIRRKTLVAEQTKDHVAECQYLFEEICAKTLYNMSMRPAPFDADSPYWIIPIALALARARHLPATLVTNIITS